MLSLLDCAGDPQLLAESSASEFKHNLTVVLGLQRCPADRFVLREFFGRGSLSM